MLLEKISSQAAVLGVQKIEKLTRFSTDLRVLMSDPFVNSSECFSKNIILKLVEILSKRYSLEKSFLSPVFSNQMKLFFDHSYQNFETGVVQLWRRWFIVLLRLEVGREGKEQFGDVVGRFTRRRHCMDVKNSFDEFFLLHFFQVKI